MIQQSELIILVACGNGNFKEEIARILSGENFKIVFAETGSEAIKVIERQKIHAAILDEFLPDKNSVELLQYCRNSGLLFPVIVISRDPSIERAIAVMKSGAYDYLPLTVSEVSAVKLIGTLKEALLRSADVFELQLSPKDLTSETTFEEVKQPHFEELIGSSIPMKKLYRLIDRVARADVTVLITGESGTGKELVAQAIHRRSNRKDKPFVPVNCGAIPEELLESEFFGHEKGAFSGAIRTKIGRFELANGGSIFLDEIGEMKSSLQVKLLRFLQERTFERVGGLKTIEVDVRVIAATNKDLWKAVQEGTFREDLFYRLNVVPIHVPPLRERKEDIPLLVEHFLIRHALSRDDGSKKRVNPEVIECFMEYSWPGNVRELENIIKRLIILSDGDEITADDLPDRFHRSIRDKSSRSPGLRLPEEGIDLKKFMEQIEKSFIEQALEKTGGVKNQAAKLLGLNRTTLIEKMKKLGMDLSYGSKS